MNISKKIVNISLLIVLLITLGGCSKEKEKNIIGAWSEERTMDDIKGLYVFVFNDDKTFTQAFIPMETNAAGFKVKGTWEISLFGNLKIQYRPSTLEAVTTYDFRDPDGSLISKHLSSIKRDVRRFNEEGGEWKIQFSKSGDDMKLTTADGMENFERMEEDDIEDIIDDTIPQRVAARSRAFVPGNTLPTSGSIHQFDYLAEHYLDAADLSSYNSTELRILRNAIYALHNYDFDSADLRSYFDNFSGYAALTKNVNLNKIEQANVNLIQKYE